MKAQPKHWDTVVKPVITEKSTMASYASTLVFEVAIGASKPEIKEAIESLFDVKVRSVNVLVRKAKRSNFRGRPGRKGKDIKKAYVRLEEGYKIDVFEDV